MLRGDLEYMGVQDLLYLTVYRDLQRIQVLH